MKTESILVLAVVVFAVCTISSSFAATASFQGLGDLPGGQFFSYAYGISADGSVVVGSGKPALGWQAYRWTESTGMQGLGAKPTGDADSSEARGASADGAVVVGYVGLYGTPSKAFRWTVDGMVGLGYLENGNQSEAYDVSSDGSAVVGWSTCPLGVQAYRWTSGSGMVGLGDLPGRAFISVAYGISDDGSVVVGKSSSSGSLSGMEAFRWSESGGMVGLGILPDGRSSYARNVSGDGAVVVGECYTAWGVEAFRWTESDGMQGLGDLAGGDFYSKAHGVSADGSVIVGKSVTSTDYCEAFIWDAENGIRSLQNVLVGDYGLELTGWTLLSAYDISNDGLTIVGYGRNPDGYPEGWIATIPEPTVPPVADADGPYTVNVGDSLTLDANGSTDDDNDIVSYIWDLDDDENFETDAGGQAIFDVNYSYLQSLGLLVDYPYNIHLKVTDSQGQSDVADSTLIIVPKPALEVAVDIKPGSCPNPLNVKSSGVLPIAILGTEDYDVITIDPTSIRLAGIEPLRSGYEDVATPVSDSNDCNCTTEGPDGFLDLTLKFETQKIVEAIGDVNDGDVLTLELTGVLYDETPIEGADCILIRGRHKPINPADINKDGVVNAADFAIFAQNWLQSSIVDE